MMTKQQVTVLLLDALRRAQPRVAGYEYVELQPGERTTFFVRVKELDKPGQLFEVHVKEVQ